MGTVLRCVPRFTGPRAADPSPSRAGAQQGREVPNAHHALRQLGQQVQRHQEDGEVPAEEGVVPGRRVWERRDERGRVPPELDHGDQLPRVAAEEELEQREDVAYQEHDGEVLPHLRLGVLSGERFLHSPSGSSCRLSQPEATWEMWQSLGDRGWTAWTELEL